MTASYDTWQQACTLVLCIGEVLLLHMIMRGTVERCHAQALPHHQTDARIIQMYTDKKVQTKKLFKILLCETSKQLLCIKPLALVLTFPLRSSSQCGAGDHTTAEFCRWAVNRVVHFS